MTHDRDDLRPIDLSPLDWRGDRHHRELVVRRIVHDVDMIWLEQDRLGGHYHVRRGLDTLGSRFRWGVVIVTSLTAIAAAWSLLVGQSRPVLRPVHASSAITDLPGLSRALTRWALDGAPPAGNPVLLLLGSMPDLSASTAPR